MTNHHYDRKRKVFTTKFIKLKGGWDFVNDMKKQGVEVFNIVERSDTDIIEFEIADSTPEKKAKVDAYFKS